MYTGYTTKLLKTSQMERLQEGVVRKTKQGKQRFSYEDDGKVNVKTS